MVSSLWLSVRVELATMNVACAYQNVHTHSRTSMQKLGLQVTPAAMRHHAL